MLSCKFSFSYFVAVFHGVKVIPEQVTSVGHVVMRKFKHLIDGKFHYWLKDDKPDETQPPYEEPE